MYSCTRYYYYTDYFGDMCYCLAGSIHIRIIMKRPWPQSRPGGWVGGGGWGRVQRFIYRSGGEEGEGAKKSTALDFWPTESKLGGTARCHWAKALRVRREVPEKNYALGNSLSRSLPPAHRTVALSPSRRVRRVLVCRRRDTYQQRSWRRRHGWDGRNTQHYREDRKTKIRFAIV